VKEPCRWNEDVWSMIARSYKPTGSREGAEIRILNPVLPSNCLIRRLSWKGCSGKWLCSLLGHYRSWGRSLTKEKLAEVGIQTIELRI